MNLDPEKLEALITPKTKAVVPVHLYGQCAQMDKIVEIAHKNNVLVIEDCAHNPAENIWAGNQETWEIWEYSVSISRKTCVH